MILVITSSPNKDGLTAACGAAALKGISAGGGEGELVDISAERLSPCFVCGNGWGKCRETAECVIDDILNGLKGKIRASGGLV